MSESIALQTFVTSERIEACSVEVTVRSWFRLIRA